MLQCENKNPTCESRDIIWQTDNTKTYLPMALQGRQQWRAFKLSTAWPFKKLWLVIWLLNWAISFFWEFIFVRFTPSLSLKLAQPKRNKNSLLLLVIWKKHWPAGKALCFIFGQTSILIFKILSSSGQGLFHGTIIRNLYSKQKLNLFSVLIRGNLWLFLSYKIQC